MYLIVCRDCSWHNSAVSTLTVLAMAKKTHKQQASALDEDMGPGNSLQRRWRPNKISSRDGQPVALVDTRVFPPAAGLGGRARR